MNSVGVITGVVLVTCERDAGGWEECGQYVREDPDLVMLAQDWQGESEETQQLKMFDFISYMSRRICFLLETCCYTYIFGINICYK